MTHTFLTQLDGPRSRHSLLVAGIDSVAELGIDQATASDIISRAAVSRPTFYSYFDDVAGLMADCWINGGIQWFDTLLWKHLPDGFDSTNEHKAFVDVLMSAHRTPELAEVVLPSIARQSARLRECTTAEQVRYLWILATRLGVSISETVMPGVRTLDKFIAALEFIPSEFVPPQDQVVALRAVEPIVTEPSIADPDEVTSHLIQAVIRVVSNSGVAKASMTRVCRAAHVTTGSAKPRFATMADLMSRGYEYAVHEVSRQNVQQAETVFGGVSPIQAYARLVMSSLHPARKSWRRYRQEMHLASRVNPAIAQQMQAAIKEVNAVLSASLRQSNVPESIINISMRVNQAQSVGFSLIDDLGIPVRDINHAVIPSLLTVELFASLA
jgi:AcrR family transcriptional regulator